MKLSVKIGPDMSSSDAYIALSEIGDMLKGIRIAGISTRSTTELPNLCDKHLSEAIQSIFEAQRTFEK